MTTRTSQRGRRYVLYSPLDPSFIGGIRTWIATFWEPFLATTGSTLNVIHAGFIPAGGAVSSTSLESERVKFTRIQSKHYPPLIAPLVMDSELHRHFSAADLIYVDNGYVLQDVVALRANRGTCAAIVSGHHAVISHGIAHRLAWELIGRRAIKAFDAVHALNEADAVLLRRSGARNVCSIPIAIDTNRFIPAQRRSPTVLFVGRLHAQKGVDRLVKIVPLLLRTYGNRLKVRVIGDGPERSQLQSLVERGAIEWHGASDATEVAAAMASATALIMPSREESFGIVAAEALTAGTPVIYSELPALAEVVGEGNGERVSAPDDPQAWLEAIAKVHLRTEIEGQLLHDRIRAEAIERFGLESVIAKFRVLVDVAIASRQQRT